MDSSQEMDAQQRKEFQRVMDIIQDYLVAVRGRKGEMLRWQLDKFRRNPEIAEEFADWVGTPKKTTSVESQAEGVRVKEALERAQEREELIKEMPSEGRATESVRRGAFENTRVIERVVREMPDGVRVEGMTARDVQKRAPFMNELGIYNYLITLKEDPEAGKRYIEEGFPEV